MVRPQWPHPYVTHVPSRMVPSLSLSRSPMAGVCWGTLEHTCIPVVLVSPE